MSMVYDIIQSSESLIAVSSQIFFDSATRDNLPQVFVSCFVPTATVLEVGSILDASETIMASTTQDILPDFLGISTFSSFETAAAAVDFNAIFAKAFMTGKAGIFTPFNRTIKPFLLRTKKKCLRSDLGQSSFFSFPCAFTCRVFMLTMPVSDG